LRSLIQLQCVSVAIFINSNCFHLDLQYEKFSSEKCVENLPAGLRCRVRESNSAGQSPIPNIPLRFAAKEDNRVTQKEGTLAQSGAPISEALASSHAQAIQLLPFIINVRVEEI
jgi:hypothetical protein